MRAIELIIYYVKYFWYLISTRDSDEKMIHLFIEGGHKGLESSYVKEYLVEKDGVQMLYHNNSWGKFKLKDDWYEQSLLTKHLPYTDGNGEFDKPVGWSFEPPLNQKGVLGYPSIVVGGSGWGMMTQSNIFPIQPKEISRLVVDYSVSLYTDNLKHNLTFDFWICSKDTGERLCEIMVWDDYKVARPFGKKKGEIGDYIVTSGYLDKSHEPGNPGGWGFVALRKRRKRTEGRLNILEILNELVKMEVIPVEFLSQNLMGIELGTEVYSSVGYCIVDKFKVDFVRK